MSYQQFVLSTTNPNDNAGGGGCICDRNKQCDCTGPFIIAYGNEMDFHLSPHVVVGAKCVDKMFQMLHEGEALAAGEATDIPATARDPQVSALPERSAPPIVESPNPSDDFDEGRWLEDGGH